MLDVARFTAEQRSRLAAVVTGLFATLNAVSVAVFPAYRASAEAFDSFLQQMPPAMRAAFLGSVTDLSTFEGFLVVEVYQSIWLGFLGAVVAYVAAGLVAGEADAGTLDLTLAQPLTRRRLLAEGFVGLVPLIVLVNLATFVVVTLGAIAVGESLSYLPLVALHGVSILYLLVCAGIGLVASVGLDGLRAAQGAAIAAVFGAFLVDGVTAPTDLDWLGVVAPSRYIDPAAILVRGEVAVVDTVVLLFALLVTLVAATWVFERRDLAV